MDEMSTTYFDNPATTWDTVRKPVTSGEEREFPVFLISATR